MCHTLGSLDFFSLCHIMSRTPTAKHVHDTLLFYVNSHQLLKVPFRTHARQCKCIEVDSSANPARTQECVVRAGKGNKVHCASNQNFGIDVSNESVSLSLFPATNVLYIRYNFQVRIGRIGPGLCVARLLVDQSIQVATRNFFA
jgi:hypothetical protein